MPVEVGITCAKGERGSPGITQSRNGETISRPPVPELRIRAQGPVGSPGANGRHGPGKKGSTGKDGPGEKGSTEKGD